MATLVKPIVGDWYKTTEGQMFEVIASDEEEQVIEVQFYDGTVEEYDFETWANLDPEEMEAPVAWSDYDLSEPDYDENSRTDSELSIHHPTWVRELEEVD